MRGAQRIRHIMAQPTFQAAYLQQYPLGPSPPAVPAQACAHSRPHEYSDVEGGIPRGAGEVWMDSEWEFVRG